MPESGMTTLNDNWSRWHGHIGENLLNGDRAPAFVRMHRTPSVDRPPVPRRRRPSAAPPRWALATGEVPVDTPGTP
jgi:hypothetical protein